MSIDFLDNITIILDKIPEYEEFKDTFKLCIDKTLCELILQSNNNLLTTKHKESFEKHIVDKLDDFSELETVYYQNNNLGKFHCSIFLHLWTFKTPIFNNKIEYKNILYSIINDIIMDYLTNEFITKSKAIHGDNYDYSKVIYTKSKQDVIISCKTHGDFNQCPSNHLIGRGCYKCGRKRVSDKKQLNKTIFIERAILIHGNKYDYSQFVYVDTSTPGIIICPIINHGPFLQTPNKHLNRKDGCKKCGRISNGIKHRTTKDEFIEKSKLIHGDNFDYSKVEYVNNSTDVTIYCKKCEDDFQQTPATHLRGSICPNCANKLNGDKCRSTKDEFIEKSKLIHGDNFDYSKVEYITAKIHVIIICNNCKEIFPQSPDHHLRGYGCKNCATNKNADRCRLTKDEFVERSIKVYGDNIHDYSQVEYTNTQTHVKIKCLIHNICFEQTPGGHMAGRHGCNKCSKKGYSKSQIAWLNFISKYNNISIQHAENGNEYKITSRLSADGFCKETNTIYEFHGDLWHGNPKIFNPDDISYFGKKYGDLYKKTIDREKKIKEMGYNVISIWESEWNKINKCIKVLQQTYRRFKCPKV